MNIQPGFEEFLKLLQDHEVDYMIVGGYAVAFHGHPRFTKDIDIFFDSDSSNVHRMVQALIAFGFAAASIPEAELATPGKVVAIGVPPVRIDLINQIDAVVFSEAQARIVRGRYGQVEANFIGREDLIRNKSATRRARDKADVEELG